MTANSELIPVKEWDQIRGFKNLFRKESRAWWGTRRWWINAVIWPVILCGLLANMLFMPTIANLATEAEIARAGSLTAHIMSMGISVFFEFGITALAIGIVILCQDLIVGEIQNGMAEWLLSKPVTYQAYLLAKLAANLIPVLILMIGLPAVLGYSLLSVRLGTLFPLAGFLKAVGVMTLHTLFYLFLALVLGTFFNRRSAILSISLGSVLGGPLLGGFIKPLLSITPWALPKIASLTASGQPVPVEIGIVPIISTALWCITFIIAALVKIKTTEF